MRRSVRRRLRGQRHGISPAVGLLHERVAPAEVELGQLLSARSALVVLARDVQRDRSLSEAEALSAAIGELSSARPDADRLAARVKHWQADEQRRQDKASALEVIESWLTTRTQERAKAQPGEVAEWLRRSIEQASAPDVVAAEGPQGAERLQVLRQELRGMEDRPRRRKRRSEPEG